MRTKVLSVILVVICVYAAVMMLYSLREREKPAAPPPASPGASASPSAAPAPGASASPPGKTVDEAAAMTIYKSSCLSCHGDQLQGQLGPALSSVGTSMSADQIRKQIENGGGGMPAFKGQLTDDQIQTITNWLAAKK